MKKKQKVEEKPKKDSKPQKNGLNFSEKKRLVELKRTLAGNSREQIKPDTAQKTITFKKMYRDGICQVTQGFYTKMVEFYDINYDPYVMVYEKPTAPPETRKLQRWVNNKWLFHAVPDFKDFDPGGYGRQKKTVETRDTYQQAQKKEEAGEA